MKTIIYYFTGTGNSLSVAKKIATTIEECELVPISSMKDTTCDVVPEADRVGIICPVYFTGLPAMVASFVDRLYLGRVEYVFSVVTNGGGGGISALTQLEGIIRRKSGRGLSAGYSVMMPGNYILMYEPPTGEKQDKILSSAESDIQRIIDDVGQCRKQPLPRSLIWSVLHAILYSWFISGVHNKDKKFSVSNKCTSCGICAAVCPADNIELVDKKPVWKHHCELCCACIHLCPVEAIQAGNTTAGRIRYRNPEVTVSELRTISPLSGEEITSEIVLE